MGDKHSYYSAQVTDTREVKSQNRPSPQRQGTRIISVDNVLQYASDIPSAQRRSAPGIRPSMHTRTPSGRHPLNPKLGADPKFTPRGTPVAPAHMPARSSKVSEKLVLLPETTEEAEALDEADEEEDEDARPPDDIEIRRRRTGKGGRSVAERLPKSQRTADENLARVTAYTTAQSYRLRSMATFIRDQHGAKTKMYDDCLYCVYQLPLLGGSEGYRVRSSPVVKNPGGRSVLDEQIEANERREYRDGWRDESNEYSVVGNEGYNSRRQEQLAEAQQRLEEEEQRQEEHEQESHHNNQDHEAHHQNGATHSPPSSRRESNQSNHSSLSFPSPQASVSAEAPTLAELFVFSYGVAVLWNFTPNQEKDLLADLTFSSTTSSIPSTSHKSGNLLQKSTIPPAPTIPLLTRPLDESDFETEEFHFQYDTSIEKPRIFNDMITLRTSDHMIKLAMSHAIGQSTKLSFFEERMQRTMAEAQYVPRKLALEGRLGMSRSEVVGLVGRLFEGRVDVNLCKPCYPYPPTDI